MLAILSRASSIIAEGEVMQLITTSDIETSEAPISRSSAPRRRSCSPPPAGSAPSSPTGRESEADALDAYGLNLGIAFQLIDDVLDYSAKQATLGKTIGDDFRDGKMTLPVVLAIRRGDDAERAFWQRTVEELDAGGRRPRAGDRHPRTSAMRWPTPSSGRAATATPRCRRWPIFPDVPLKRALVDVVDFCIERAY